MSKLNGQDVIDSEFDPDFLTKFTKCLEKIDPKLLKSVNFQWKGFQNYSKMDEWKQCDASINKTMPVKLEII